MHWRYQSLPPWRTIFTTMHSPTAFLSFWKLILTPLSFSVIMEPPRPKHFCSDCNSTFKDIWKLQRHLSSKRHLALASCLARPETSEHRPRAIDINDSAGPPAPTQTRSLVDNDITSSGDGGVGDISFELDQEPQFVSCPCEPENNNYTYYTVIMKYYIYIAIIIMGFN